MAFTDVSKMISEQYKLLSEKERQMYQKQADEMNVVKLAEFEKNNGSV
jgi:hypothetical protein